EGCPTCEALLADLREASTALGVSLAPVAPRPELRRSILASLGPSRAAARPSSPYASRILAAAAALLLAVVVLDDARLRRDREDIRSQTAQLASRLQTTETELAQRVLRARVLESEDVQMMPLGGQGPQPG